MKKLIFALLTLALFVAVPVMAQVDSTATTVDPGGGWQGTAAMVVSGLLLVASIVFGVKYNNAKKALESGAGQIGGAIGNLQALFFEIKILIDMVPATLEDNKVTEAELKTITIQLKLISVKAKAVLTVFQKSGLA